MVPHDAIVLAGGSARRLGGVDKPAQQVGHRTLLDRAVEAVAGAGTVVVVGPPRPTSKPVRWVQESQPGAGPAAALAAGLPHVGAEVVLVLAADLPFAAAATPRLLAALETDGGLDGALVLDRGGRPQPLLAAYRTRALRAAVARAGGLADRPLRALLADLRLQEVAAEGEEALDCDTPAALARARSLADTETREAGG